MTVLITLTTAGADSGPFDLYSNLDGYVSAFETGVSKSSLLAGYSSALVPNGTTIVRIKSTGICTNYIDVTVVTTTTTTSTSTSTTTSSTTPVPCDCTYYDATINSSDIDNAISNTDTSLNGKVWITYYDCETGTPTNISYTIAGTYDDAFCNNNVQGAPIIYYYTLDNPVYIVNSSVSNTGVCCTPLPPPL